MAILSHHDHVFFYPPRPCSFGQGGSFLLLQTATNFLPPFLLTFFPSSVSSLMSLTHGSRSTSSSDTRSHSSSTPLARPVHHRPSTPLSCPSPSPSQADLPSKCPAIHPANSSTSVIEYTQPPGLTTYAYSALSWLLTMRALCLRALKCGSGKQRKRWVSW